MTNCSMLPLYVGHHLGSIKAGVCAVWQTRNPNKCTPYLRAISTKIEISSTTRGGTSQNSTDLDSGRRPKLKFEEFFEISPLVVET